MIKIASVNIFTRIKRRLIDNWIDETSNTLYDFSPWRNKSFWGNINNTLETNETIFSAVTRLANSLSSMPIKLYEDYKVINTNVSELLTISPNNSVSSYDFINQIETVRNEKGNAYVLIERYTFSQPSKLYLRNSDI